MINYEILAVASGRERELFEARDNIYEKIKVTSPADLKAAEDSDEEASHLLQMSGNVGHIEVRGALTSRDSFWNRYFGAVSYGEIKKATMQALEANAAAIVYNYTSPGGEVRGMSELGNFIAALPIPTVTFADYMASAAYFLGCQSDYVYASDFAEVGSIGVLVKVYDRTKMNEQYGIKVERFRSGDLKASGDPDFKLTDKEKTHIQSQMDTYAAKFFKIVSDARGLPLEAMEKMGITSGRTFIGEEAKKVNLIDKVVTFEQAMQKAYDLAAKHIDKTSSSKLNWMK